MIRRDGEELVGSGAKESYLRFRKDRPDIYQGKEGFIDIFGNRAGK